MVDLDYKGVPCFMHTLQPAMDTALKHNTMAQILVESRRIVTHFNHSNQVSKKLRDLQQELNLSGHQFVQDVCTRWNSTDYMISRLFEQKPAVSLYLAETSVNFENLSNEEWTILRKSIELLKPFKGITKIIRSSRSSLSEVIPGLKTLQKYLEIYNDENMEMKVLLENDWKSRFDVNLNKVYTLATLLDLRCTHDGRSKAAHELQCYCALPVIKRDDDLFQWWSRNNSRYPEMSRIASVPSLSRKSRLQ
ncbi:Zinc finger BED domain-containing protein 4 [Eumeta japonica]|uniref:Zinc finger BED domain-containing protein 4 n=1 Tax=Eumeta variegata TaxID=151549 RepID=A0A4C1YGY4_EUMVA|nr:Zinc finger BED domain-containing protein 4 [Eumeta japonica]